MFAAKADKKVTPKVDIWALGVTMYYLLTGRHAFEDIKEEDVLRKQIMEVPINLDCIRNPDTKLILSSMLEIDQEKRANIDDIINSDWITDHGDEILCLNHRIEDDKS